ncbi:MAG: DUF2975 domain-containing protein [Bacteroidaceae bacterium]|nr:DUF2975 domain-containing protein [Bacteroidaceae bacterium]
MEKKKLKKMITWSTILVETILLAIGLVVRHIYDVPWVIIALFYVPLLVLSLALLSKYFSKGKWKDSMDELERECEEEERREEKKVEKSNVTLMWIVLIVCMIIAVGDTIEITGRIILRSYGGNPVKELLPEVFGPLTMAICAVFIVIILFNVNRNRVFDHTNVKMIYGVGVTLIISTMLQNEIWDSTLMVPNSTLTSYFYLFGMFFIFLGKLFEIAIKIKKENDMTV